MPSTLPQLYITNIPLTIMTRVSERHAVISTNGNSLNRTQECLVLSFFKLGITNHKISVSGHTEFQHIWKPYELQRQTHYWP